MQMDHVPKPPLISSKPLRYLAMLTLLGAMAWPLLHLYIVQNSGTVVATADVVLTETHPSEEAFSRYFRDYQYFKLSFAPVELSPDMGQVKVSLSLQRSGLFLKQSSIGAENFKNLKLPQFFLTDTKDGTKVWENESTRTATEKDLGGGFKMTSVNTHYGFKSEGMMTVGAKKSFYYSLGMLEVPATSQYAFTVDNLVMRTDVLNIFKANPRELKVDFITGAQEVNMTQIYYCMGAVVIAAFLLFLTGPRHKVKRRRKD